jgi:hypothetical protein
MPVRFSNVALMMLLVTCLVTGLPGCAHLANRRNCDTSPSCPAAVSTLKNSLPTIEFETRAAIQFSDLTNPIEGSPIGVDPANRPAQKPVSPKLLRDLTLIELRRLANQSAPIATRLESHRDWLATLERTPPAILEALTHQARFERSKHRHLATAAYLNLVQVYTKSPILNRTDEVLLEAEKAIEKFRQAGIEVPGDQQELQRRQIEITEQYVEVRYNQLRLNDALESLLNLTPFSQEPIWTNFQMKNHPPIPHESEAVELAFSQRGDLHALEQLSCDSQSLSLDFLRGSDPASSLIGAGFDMPAAAKFWQCWAKDEIECLKQSAQGERKRQLQLLVENKREQIRLEVRQSLHAIERHEGNLKLKLIRLDSLRESMATSEKAKDIHPIDFKVRLEQRTDELKLISDIIDELIAIEIEHDKLNHNLGSS